MYKRKQHGFTIVELLIVIVVVGVLAAITITAYNGIQNRAKFSSAQSLASTISKKASLFQATYGRFPTLIELANNRAADSAVDGSGTLETKLPPSIAVTGHNATNGTTTVSYEPYCPGTRGAFIDYWDYPNNRTTTGSSTPRSFILGEALTC